MEKRKLFKLSVIQHTMSKAVYDQNIFYTSDSDLMLKFELIEKEYEYERGEVLLYNDTDKSFVTRTLSKADDGFVYKIESDIIQHFGEWTGQLQLVKNGEVYTSKPFQFTIENDLSTVSPPQLIDINSWATLKQSAIDLIDDMQNVISENENAALAYQQAENVRNTNEIGRKQAESTRQNNETTRQNQERNRESNEVVRKSNEVTRLENESTRQVNESERQQAEIERVESYQEVRNIIDNFEIGENSVGTENIKDNSVTADKINPVNGEPSVNVLNPDDLLQGQFHNSVGGKAVLTVSANWSTTKTPIKVTAGDVVSFNKAYSNNHYYGVDDSDTILQSGKANADGITQITVSNGVTAFYSNIQNVYLDGAMITINNPMPDEFVPYGVTVGQSKKLEWLTVSESNLDNDLKNKINSENTVAETTSDWKDKTMIAAGDSITWQDGRVYSGTTNVARGWQTVVKENLELASVNNIALSGKPMADGTTAGGGTVTTVLEETSLPQDLFVIAAGTNDFKLNTPIGELKNVGDEFDRNSFYGAYQTTLEYILSKRTDIRIVLFTPLHRNNSNYNSTIFTNTAGHKLIDYVEAIKAIGARYSIPVCDMYANSGINMLTLDVDTRDGLHPNDVGYAKMGRYATKFIDNL